MKMTSRAVYFPLFLNLRGYNCLVVGGGAVALRKVRALLRARAYVKVVSPQVVEGLEELARTGRVKLSRRRFLVDDLKGVSLVVASTSESSVNELVAYEARKRGIFCNVVDQPELCSAIVPAILSRGRLQIAVSTGGASPAMARWLRDRLCRIFGEEYELALEILFAIRKRVLSRGENPEENKKIFERLIESRLLEFCKNRQIEKLNALISEATGEAFDVRELKII